MPAILRRGGCLLAIVALAGLRGSAGTAAHENPLLALLRNQLHAKMNKQHSGRNPLAFLGRNRRGTMPMELQKMMAASASKLAQAEAHHEKVVKQARADLESLLSKQAEVLGGAIGRYGAALDRVEANLAQTTNSTEAAAAKVHLRGGSSSWEGPDVEARATLSAKVQVARSEARRLARQRLRAVQEADSDAESLFEEATQPLSRKVGDLSETLSTVKTSLEGSEASATRSAASVGHPGAAAAPANVTFDLLEKQLAAAKGSAASGVADAKKELDTTVKQVGKDLAKGVADIKKDLDDAQKQEIQNVRTTPAFAPKAAKATKAHKKTL